jgi:hypothetical protein
MYNEKYLPQSTSLFYIVNETIDFISNMWHELRHSPGIKKTIFCLSNVEL